MNSSLVRISIWSRKIRWLDLWAKALDTDVHEITSQRIDALERRLEKVEAVLPTAGSPDHDPA